MSALRLYNVNETAEILGCSKTTAYKLLQTGQLKGVKAGRAWKVTSIALAKFIGVEAEELREELKAADLEAGVKVASR